MELTMLDYLAQQINNAKAHKNGYAASVRWSCLNQEIKNECLKEAEQMFEDWKADELQSIENRERMLKGVVIKHYED